MKIKEIISYLEEIAPLSYQEHYDNSGLIVGEVETEITNMMVCLDCTLEVVNDAISQNCNFIIAHHPIVFDGLKRFNNKNYIEQSIIRAIKNDISIYAIHTNLDNVLMHGVNQKIAEKIGLSQCQILAPKKNLLCKVVVFVPNSHLEHLKSELAKAGAGKIGNYDSCSFTVDGTGSFKPLEGSNAYVGEIGQLQQEQETRLEVLVNKHQLQSIIQCIKQNHPYEEPAYDIYPIENSNPEVGSGIIGYLPKPITTFDFLNMLKNNMKLSVIKYTEIDKAIQKIAICGGSGSFLLPNAIQSNADVIITSDFKYHQFFDANKKIMICDIGHYESEQFTIELIIEIISKKFTKFAPIFTKINTNPVKYY